jgi:hypothetical protein
VGEGGGDEEDSMEKWLCLAAMGAAGLLVLIFGLDLVSGIPFNRGGGVGWRGYTQDILIVLAAGLVLWQGYETWREMA